MFQACSTLKNQICIQWENQNNQSVDLKTDANGNDANFDGKRMIERRPVTSYNITFDNRMSKFRRNKLWYF